MIFGNDLVSDAGAKRSTDLTRHLCNTYRVLLSRGMKVTLVCFLDAGTREYFEQLLGQGGNTLARSRAMR